MFSLNLNGILVLTMFKKSYFLKLGRPPQTGFYGCSVNFATLPWKSTCCCVIVWSVCKQNTRPNCFLIYIFFRKKYLGQPSIDFDFWNFSSFRDVVYKERGWNWHKLATDLFYDLLSILLLRNAIKLENISNLIASPFWLSM